MGRRKKKILDIADLPENPSEMAAIYEKDRKSVNRALKLSRDVPWKMRKWKVDPRSRPPEGWGVCVHITPSKGSESRCKEERWSSRGGFCLMHMEEARERKLRKALGASGIATVKPDGSPMTRGDLERMVESGAAGVEKGGSTAAAGGFQPMDGDGSPPRPSVSPNTQGSQPDFSPHSTGIEASVYAGSDSETGLSQLLSSVRWRTIDDVIKFTQICAQACIMGHITDKQMSHLMRISRLAIKAFDSKYLILKIDALRRATGEGRIGLDDAMDALDLSMGGNGGDAPSQFPQEGATRALSVYEAGKFLERSMRRRGELPKLDFNTPQPAIPVTVPSLKPGGGEDFAESLDPAERRELDGAS